MAFSMNSSSSSKRIEDYALLGNFESAALVSKDGSIDWLCLPRFDSPACFAALLGGPDQGHWRICPESPGYRVTRHYRRDTLILETEFITETGKVRLIDCMPHGLRSPTVVRIAQGIHGEVRMNMEIVFRFDYGSIVPWVTRDPFGWLKATAGPDSLRLRTTVPLVGRDMKTVASFTLKPGQRIPFVMSWTPSYDDIPYETEDPIGLVNNTAHWWRNWLNQCNYRGPYANVVRRSIITLKALTHERTGGIVAAPTTSLPEKLGGVRNWDYRYCWLRDSTFTLYALLHSGYKEEARRWKDWVLRSVAGTPAQLNIMYGVSGERRLVELELPWLPGYEGSKPVRQGNAAYTQLQLDVFGELMDAFHLARKAGIERDATTWQLQKSLMQFLEGQWSEPDNGIWEVRGERRHFVFSKVMTWLAFDRAIRAIEQFGMKGPLDRWKKIRAEIHAEVCEKGFDPELGSFVQSYGSKSLDASLLQIAMVGFLPIGDRRIQGTIDAVKKNLMIDGFVRRYDPKTAQDGLPGDEGIFLACTFWLVDCLVLQGKKDEARQLFERAISVRNDLGLLAEEYDPSEGRLLGNFPQGFSHISLINSAFNLAAVVGPAHHRSSPSDPATTQNWLAATPWAA
jgi:GH15 family glucan-1,4-alpha-glucosidase